MPNNHRLSVIGHAQPKIEAMQKVTGETRYADDLSLPRMIYGKLLRSVHPHARIVGIDTSRALALPGVFAVITGKDVPIKFGIMPSTQDEEALCVDRVRFVGDPVAAVAAIDEETAERALDLIEVEYAPLAPVMTMRDALDETLCLAPIHDYADHHNVHNFVSLEFGDLEAGFKSADYIREDIFFYEGNTHLPMEEHSCIGHFSSDGKLTLYSSTQTPHYVHRALEKTLQVPRAHIRVIAAPVSGGFGGKTDPFSHEIVACKLSMLTGRPVKITLTREEVFYTHRGRHPVLMWVKSGVKRDGQITALHFKTMHDGGRAINPLLVIGQTEGGAYMGFGEALFEESAFRKGMHKIPSLLDYKSPTTLDMPKVEALLVETIDPEGPYGAKEAGQGPLLPVPPAIANAIFDAVGVRIDQVPITPDKVLKALEEKAKGKEPRYGPKDFPVVQMPETLKVAPPESAPRLVG